MTSSGFEFGSYWLHQQSYFISAKIQGILGSLYSLSLRWHATGCHAGHRDILRAGHGDVSFIPHWHGDDWIEVQILRKSQARNLMCLPHLDGRNIFKIPGLEDGSVSERNGNGCKILPIAEEQCFDYDEHILSNVCKIDSLSPFQPTKIDDVVSGVHSDTNYESGGHPSL